MREPVAKLSDQLLVRLLRRFSVDSLEVKSWAEPQNNEEGFEERGRE
jgi:hypothetical protein